MVDGTTVGQAKNKWSEVMFYLAGFFGSLHFLSIVMQVTGMFMHTTLKRDLGLPFTSSMLMGHIYLTFLAAYVGQKEFVRWFKRADEDVLSEAEGKKITRGTYIVVVWGVFTGLVVFAWQAGLITEVPNVLLYTLGEIVALLCGTEASKYLRTRQAGQVKQDASNRANYGDRAIDLCKEKGSIDNEVCQLEFGLSQDQSSRLLAGLVKAGKLKSLGSGRARKYVAA
jgi:hypothetical protein